MKSLVSAMSNRDWPLDAEALLELGSKSREENFWTINDAFQGCQVFGATGSGKSSGSGKAIATAFLESNMGGLVLTAKTDERHNWQQYCRDAGRIDDLMIFGEAHSHRFNFLRYEFQRKGNGGGDTESLVNLFWAVMEVADRKSGGGSSADAYWSRALKQLLRNSIDLLVIATGELDLPYLYRLITSAPASLAQVDDAKWQASSECYTLLEVAKAEAPKNDRQEDYEITRAYWLKEFANLAVETRTAIVSMFTSMADCFLRGTLRKLFCADLNLEPEDCFKGKIILMDLPVKEYHELGIFAQVLFKYVWQRAVERRIPPLLGREKAQETIRPVFLWADESQFFATPYDAMFQSTARSSRACTVYLTQNLPGYQAALGAAGGKAAAEAFLGNLQTKIFHANGDPQTNNWASDSIGRMRQVQVQGNLSQGQQTGNSSQTAGGTMTVEYVVQPQEFTELRTGGPENEDVVDSVIFQGGRRWLVEETGKWHPRNFIRHTFKQF